MNEKEIDELTKDVYLNCEIYPKSNPKQIKSEINKINTLLSISETKTPKREKLISRISKSMDMKQRIKQEGSWIKYSV